MILEFEKAYFSKQYQELFPEEDLGSGGNWVLFLII